MLVIHSKKAQKLIDKCKFSNQLEWSDLADLVAYNGDDVEQLSEKCFEFVRKHYRCKTFYKVIYDYDIFYFAISSEQELVDLIKGFIKNNE